MGLLQKLVKEQHYSANIYDATMPYDVLSKFEDNYLNLSYKNVMMFNLFVEKKQFQEALLAINYRGNIDDKLFQRLNFHLLSPRFYEQEEDQLKILYERGDITLEELENEYRKMKKMCHRGDFDLIYALFIERYGIDLNKDDILWFEYKMLLSNLLEEKENSLLMRIGHRNFKPRKGKDYKEYNKQGEKLKRLYSYA